ncbi:hypothetical protein CEXT_446651 [Caerostris extrusa]|uniref:Uncharacterized protein n=1 Tax=Caerostris extrusa TaxID=172846 RepID=A0AAV4NEV7_CAEEX|nr:hypothetical protein CEXT_446651 [Caerostris extrusa]
MGGLNLVLQQRIPGKEDQRRPLFDPLRPTHFCDIDKGPHRDHCCIRDHVRGQSGGKPSVAGLIKIDIRALYAYLDEQLFLRHHPALYVQG